MQTPQPFQPGDKVIRIGNSEPQWGMFRDQVYTVDEIEYCCEQRGWCISVVEAPIDMYRYVCMDCNRLNPKPWGACRFRKVEDISDHTVDSVLEELSEPVRELVSI